MSVDIRTSAINMPTSGGTRLQINSMAKWAASSYRNGSCSRLVRTIKIGRTDWISSARPRLFLDGHGRANSLAHGGW